MVNYRDSSDSDFCFFIGASCLPKSTLLALETSARSVAESMAAKDAWLRRTSWIEDESAIAELYQSHLLPRLATIFSVNLHIDPLGLPVCSIVQAPWSGIDFHHDYDSAKGRELSCCLWLTDVDEADGGALIVKKQDGTTSAVQPQRGAIFAFIPSEYSFHAISPMHRGERMSVLFSFLISEDPYA